MNKVYLLPLLDFSRYIYIIFLCENFCSIYGGSPDVLHFQLRPPQDAIKKYYLEKQQIFILFGICYNGLEIDNTTKCEWKYKAYIVF